MVEQVVLVTKATPLAGLVARYGTLGQAQFVLETAGANFSGYVSFDNAYLSALDHVRRAIPDGTRLVQVDASLVPTYQFDPNAWVVTLGPDGLVVNTAKYLQGQPIFPINPDPSTIDGVLAANRPWQLANALRGDRVRESHLRMAEAALPDGQRLRAVNDLFVGHASHQSARYTLEHGDTRERQSSSGLIISTGVGSTGWRRSVLAGAAGVLRAYGHAELAQEIAGSYAFDWERPELVYSVREPFISRVSSAELVYGVINENAPLVLQSEMPSGGVVFSDGVESDFLAFNSGARLEVTVSQHTTRLLLA